MKIVENRCGKLLIPKRKITDAAKKLAMYEDTGLTPAQILKMDRLHAEKCAEVGNLKARLNNLKTELMDYLDEIDGLIIDDPIDVIRGKVDELFD